MPCGPCAALTITLRPRDFAILTSSYDLFVYLKVGVMIVRDRDRDRSAIFSFSSEMAATGRSLGSISSPVRVALLSPAAFPGTLAGHSMGDRALILDAGTAGSSSAHCSTALALLH